MVHFYVMMRRTSINNYKLETETKPDIDILSVRSNSGEGYEIDNYIDVISHMIYSDINEFIDSSYVYEDVRYGFFPEDKKKKKYKFDIEPEAASVGISSIIVHIDPVARIYGYTKVNTTLHTYIDIEYSVIPIDSDDLGYLVSEHIKTGDPDNPVITKCYHELFSKDELDDALRYLDTEIDYNKKTEHEYFGEFKIFPVSISSMIDSEWYKVNMETNNIMRRYGISREEYRMISDLDFLGKKVRSDSYGRLSFDDRCEIDNMICHILSPYIPRDLFDEMCGGNIDNVDDSELEEVANMFMIWALIDAKSEDDFNKIIDVLGPYAGRVNQLNDEANYNKGKGYVLVSKSGQIKWYSECYAINDWYGCKDNYYHGKFQPNMNPLPCFSGYHPEYFVDKLATSEDVQKCEQMYNESIWESRREHGELRFRNYPTDEMIMCSGVWYLSGVESEDCVKDAKFFSFYFRYNFDEEQAKKLLNGEELVVDDYESKNSGRIKITVKLREATRFTEYVNCEVYRPDQDPTARNSILMAIGAKEPTNPYQ